ncbi:MAG TPA: adenylate/guanylate cyclase domain-containing protein [Tepidisphaeraceae bacterium]|jgi:adenylate cyclase
MGDKAALERRLVAVLASDVAGYSRLMQGDEAGTLKALEVVNGIAKAQIDLHRGRIANTAGDSIIAVFGSAVDAASCALIIQEVLIQQSQDNHGLQLRMGIHLGDVVDRNGDVFGTAVNIAARLEGIAQPGGIVVSSAVRDDVLGKLPASFTSIGEQTLKNIDRPIHAYALTPQIGAAPASLREADARLDLPQLGGVSIAVLPFVNLGRDPAQEYIADGLTEDLITELSHLKHFLVIARNTVFTYKGRQVDVGQVGKELGVNYVLEGSIRAMGPRIRITAQLIEAKSSAHLWAEKFDRNMDELFDVQDEVVRAVAASTQTTLLLHEGDSAQRATNLDQWSLMTQGYRETFRFTSESLRKSEEIARQFVNRFPAASRAHSLLAVAMYHQVLMGFREATKELKDDILREAREGLRLDPNDEYSLTTVAMVLLDLFGKPTEALPLLTRALDLNPNFAWAYGLLGDVNIALDNPDEAVRFSEMAIRLNPRAPNVFFHYAILAAASFTKQDHNKTLHWANQTIALKPDYWVTYAILSASFAENGDLQSARHAASRILEIWPDVTISRMKESINLPPSWGSRFDDGLIAVGIPL